ncbi:hypothetical protein DFP73DRAFT_598773 [Morchella snyderi]|nr:hypothetical protein DFP73DRAFT_598773 [Morchella snyderi]
MARPLSAALRKDAGGSGNASLTWLLYQDRDTREIRSLFRNSAEAAFVKTSVHFPPGIESTSIAIGPKGNSGCTIRPRCYPNLFHLKVKPSITLGQMKGGGGGCYKPFSSERPYPPRTAIAATKDKLICSTENNQIEVNVYDSSSNK